MRYTVDACPDCGKYMYPDSIHICTPQKQAEALRLADELLDGMNDEHWNQLNADAAAELRRLHAEVETWKACLFQAQEAAKTFAGRIVADEALLRQALEALEWADNAMFEGTPIQVNTQKAIAALKERLK